MASSRPSSNPRRSYKKGPVTNLKGWPIEPRNAEFTYRDCMNSIGQTRNLTRMNNHQCRHAPTHAKATRPPVPWTTEKLVNLGDNVHGNGYPKKMRNQRRTNTAPLARFSRMF